MPASSRAATRGFPPVCRVQGHDSHRGAAVDVQRVVLQQDVSLDAEAQFRLAPVQRVGLPPAEFPVATSTAAATAPSAAVLPAAV